MLNLKDILYMRSTGKIKLGANLVDILWWKKLYSAVEKIVTITGNPLSFITKEAQTAISTKITMEPIQEGSGDPSPTNVRPISGRTQVKLSRSRYTPIECLKVSSINRVRTNIVGSLPNLIVETEVMWENYIQYASIFGSYMAETASATRVILGEYNNIIRVNTNTRANASTPVENVNYGEYHHIILNNATDTVYVDGISTSVNSRTGASNNNLIKLGHNSAIVVYFKYFKAYDRETLIFDGIPCVSPDGVEGLYDTVSQQFFYAENEEPIYDPINEITISFGEEVYGGTLDLTSGVLTVDRGYVDLGSLSYSRGNGAGTWISYLFYVNISGMKRGSGNISADIITSIYKVEPNATTSTLNNKSCNSGLSNSYIYIRDDDYTSTQTFIESVKGEQLVYELETPITIQLTPQQVQLLKGANTLWTDGDSIELTYIA